MMKKMASAVGGKTARACDGCVKKRARWYCAADDAFLCQVCDSSVHCANPLAKRHERVRLKTASSFKQILSESKTMPSWQRDVIRKPRTPRGGKQSTGAGTSTPRSGYGSTRNPFSLVPEVGVDETTSVCENGEQLVYTRVPVYDPFVAELCTSANSNVESKFDFDQDQNSNSGIVNPSLDLNPNPPKSYDVSKFKGFLASEMDLEEFAADVESLLGKGLENESYNMDSLGLVEIVKEENKTTGKNAFDMMSFEYDDCSGNCGVEEIEVDEGDDETKENVTMVMTSLSKEKMLRLDYEEVIESWAGVRCPWACGTRPNIDPAHCWPTCMVCSLHANINLLT